MLTEGRIGLSKMVEQGTDEQPYEYDRLNRIAQSSPSEDCQQVRSEGRVAVCYLRVGGTNPRARVMN